MNNLHDSNYCLVTYSNNSTVPKTRLLILTFLEHNSHWFNGNIYIVLDSTGISKSAKNSISELYDNIKYIETDELDSSKMVKYAFNIKSSGTFYIDPNSIVQLDISNCLSAKGISSTSSFGPNYTVDCDLPSNRFITNFMFISSLVDIDLVYDKLKESNNITESLYKIVSDLDIPVTCDILIGRTEFYKNNKYPVFVRYSKYFNIILYLNSNHSDYSRVNLYWISTNKRKIENSSRITKRVSSPIRHQKDQISASTSLNNLDKKTALCTICNDDFIKGAQVMIHSFLKNNKWFNGDIIVMYSDTLSVLSEESKNKLRAICDTIIFRKIDESSYQEAINRFVNKEGVHLNFMPSLFTFEVFSITGYDQVLYVDSDILHANSMLDMIKIDGDFIVTPAALSYPSKKHHDFSGGVFMIRGKMISDSIKDRLLKFSLTTNRFKLLDQTIMNDFFKKSKMTWASNDFNCSKRCFDDKNFHNFNDKISLIHYVAEKPWNSKINPRERSYSKLEFLWTEYYNRFFERNEKVQSKKVLVIGNSPNISNYEVGTEIDKFDTVIRVNDFRTIGFEKYVGTKTDKVITSFATNFSTFEYDSIIPSQVMMSLFDKKGQKKFLNNRIKRYKLSDVNVLPDYYYLGLNEEIGLTGVKRCSSGTIALKWAIDNYPGCDIYVHGIDLIESDAHYFKQSNFEVDEWKKSIDIYHDFSKERQYINELLKHNIVKKLV